jgi:hypothetical protein
MGELRNKNKIFGRKMNLGKTPNTWQNNTKTDLKVEDGSLDKIV